MINPDKDNNTDLRADPLLAGIFALGRHRRYAPGNFIVCAGDTASTLYLILSGSVAVMIDDASGDETMLDHLFPGEMFGELCLSPDFQFRSANVVAREPLELIEVAATVYLQAATEDPRLWLAVIRQLSNRLHAASERVRLLARHSAARRITGVLRELSTKPDAVSTRDGRLVSITRQELANMAGCSREVVSRSLQELARAGLVELTGRQILVRPVLDP